jgi:hypothetical protein
MSTGDYMVTRCEITRRFRTCGRPGIAVCQYCGRSFCNDHGARLEDGQEICNETTCGKKKDDLIRHFAFKETVAGRNAKELCGDDACAAAPKTQCSKCKGLFCLEHLTERTLEAHDGSVSRAAVCSHCHKRRKLWSRR